MMESIIQPIIELFLSILDNNAVEFCLFCTKKTVRLPLTGRCTICHMDPECDSHPDLKDATWCQICGTRTIKDGAFCTVCCGSFENLEANEDLVRSIVCHQCETQCWTYRSQDGEETCHKFHPIHPEHNCVPDKAYHGDAYDEQCYCGNQLYSCQCGKIYCIKCGHEYDTDQCKEDGCRHEHNWHYLGSRAYCETCDEDMDDSVSGPCTCCGRYFCEC